MRYNTYIRKSHRIIALLLILALLFNTAPLQAEAGQISMPDTENLTVMDPPTSPESPETDQVNDLPEQEDMQEKTNKEQDLPSVEEKKTLPTVWMGYILIDHYAQLAAVGSGQPVRALDTKEETFGSGDIVCGADGKEVCYSDDASYILVSDITIPNGTTWMIPDGFTGNFFSVSEAEASTGENLPVDKESPWQKECTVYDKATDTIFVHNPFQLMVMAGEEREKEPVLSLDYDSSTFGTGQLIYPDGEENGYLCYDPSHHYVLSQNFSIETPVTPSVRGLLKASSAASTNESTGHIDGRDYFGQVSVTIDGVDYILIGDRQQLDAINDNSTTRTHVCGPVFKVTQTRTFKAFQGAEENWTTESVELVYPGDADLIGGVGLGGNGTDDFSESPLYDKADVGHLLPNHAYDYHDLASDPAAILTTTTARTVYCATDANGEPDVTRHGNNDNRADSLTYTKNGNYIIFRDIDMTTGALDGTNWRPLMFTGTMYGAKAENADDASTLWNAEKTAINMDTARKPEICNVTVVPETLTQLGKLRLDLGKQTGVGFFGTLSGDRSDSSIIRDPVIVNNIRLRDGTVTNLTTKADVDVTLVSGLLTVLGTTLGVVLDPVLKLLTGKDIGLREMLTGLLNARAKDPASLATGAFAGRIIGDAQVLNCEVTDFTITTAATEYESNGKIVGKGGFVGHAEGETRYDTLSLLVGTVGQALTDVLNVIPGVGLGDLITVLLDNALPLEDLIPTGYSSPEITGCSVDACTMSTEDGKYGVGGFAGSICGTIVSDCRVQNSTMTVNADHFGGGFCGIARDAVIKGTLSGLGIDIGSLHPQSELVRCSILDTDMTVTGGTYLGGFAGAMANSYGINDTVADTAEDSITGSLTVSGTGDFAGGFTGYAHLGTVFDFGDYLEESSSVLSTVKGLVTGLLGSGSDQSLLDLGGVAPSAIMGVDIDVPLSVSSDGAFVGGIVGRGNGTYITPSNEVYLRKLGKYNDKDRNGDYKTALPIAEEEGRANTVTKLVSISAGLGQTDSTHADKSYAGGLAGYLTSANVGGLLGDTAGIGQYLGFTVSDTTITGVGEGCTVSAAGDYAAGGIGWAVGGDVRDTELFNLRSVTAANFAGGFVGAAGPGDLVSGNGIDLQLLGISLIKIDNLLSLASGIRSTYMRANATGTDSGFTVEETALRDAGDPALYMAGGWAAQANSVRVVDCHADKLFSVQANMHDGYAGGFVGSSSAGGLAGIVEDDANLSVAQVGQLVNAVPYLVPSYDGCFVRYVSGGYVEGDTAGGFAGDFQSGKVNTYTDSDTDPISDGDYSAEYTGGYTHGTSAHPCSVYNIDHVRGGKYAGGWGGNVYSGALVSAGGGLSVLGGAASATLSASQLLGVASVYVPVIRYAGVSSPTTGYTVYAAHDYEDGTAPAASGYAGGFIGYGSGVQVSYSNVDKLRRGAPLEPSALTASDEAAYARFGVKPDALESGDGSSYMRFDNAPSAIPYAVAGAYYAGGYIGCMDVGSAASVGDGLKLLENSISLTNVLDVLSVVVSTVEHSDVTGCPGGFSVIASPRINLHDGTYGDVDGKGRGYAGGYAGKIAGGHIQDGNVRLFGYIIGEIAAGGYAGEAEPGSAASILKDSSTLSLLGEVNSLASLVEDFVPTIRNSETTCVPCGGVVRAECFSDGTGGGSVIRGMAGGYIGHSVGAQIWGSSDDVWKEENSEADLFGRYTQGAYTGEKRECAAIRIRSVYGAEYAGGYCGLMECGSTAQTGGLSLLGGLLSADNLLGALNAVYPTIRHGAVYGPLMKTDLATWNAWVDYVGRLGAFYPELHRLGRFLTQEELDAAIGQFIYGTHVVSGRHEYDNASNTVLSGCAGGFVGAMHSGVIRYSHAEAVKLVSAMRAAGGFAGEMQTKGLAEFGTVNLLGILPLNLGNIVSLADVFVPCISDAGTQGYRQGLTVQAVGDKDTNGAGCAGGFTGGCYGGQLGREHDHTEEPVWIRGLKAVHGTYCIGGFMGRCSAASVLDANLNDASSGLLQGLLNSLISTPSSLLSLLDATLSTVKFAEVTPADEAWGFIVDGEYTGAEGRDYADYAGGFAGSLEAAVLGERRNEADTLTVSGLRYVNGGYYAGGFFGLADVTSVANVGSSSGTSLLSLIQLGNTSLLNAFRTYIYHASVTGVDDGIRVYAHKEASRGTQNMYQVSGGAGGFGGGLMNGTVENSSVSGLSCAEAPNYAAGFAAQMGKSGVLDLEQVQVTNDSLLGRVIGFLGIDPNAAAQLLSIVGSTVKGCRVDGMGEGFIVRTTQAQSTTHNNNENTAFLTGSCAGGFTGFADTAQIEDCHVGALKYVESPQAAGGFIGRSSMAYIAEVDVDLTLVNALLTLLSPVIDVLYGLSSIDLISIQGGDILGLKLLSDGDLIYLDLFGLEIGVSLMEDDPEYEGSSDSLTITLGSSTIKLPYNPEDGYNSSAPNASINLIEGNRTSLKNCTVTGIDDGYDVFGGGAGQDADGTDDTFGYAGGFIGFNEGGYLAHDRMWLCDVVRGSSGITGPFVGSTVTGSRHQDYLEGNDNRYSIYRSRDPQYGRVETDAGTVFGTSTDDSAGGTDYNRYDVLHYDIIKGHGDLEGAMQKGAASAPLDAYASSAKAVLMLDAPLPENAESEAVAPDELKDPCEETFDLHVHKKWRDYNDLFGARPSELEVEVYIVDVGTAPRSQLVQAILPESGLILADPAILEQQYPGFTDRFGEGNPIILKLRADDTDGTLHWKSTLEDLPAAYRISDDETEVHYLQYVVVERVPDHYRLLSYRLLEDSASVVLTNELSGLVLPPAGGEGAVPLLLAGLFIILCAVFVLVIMRRSGRRPASFGRPPGNGKTSERIKIF